MTNSTPETKDIVPRRRFLGHIGGAVVLGLASLATEAPLGASASSAARGFESAGRERRRQ
jgi:hypothetical protein